MADTELELSMKVMRLNELRGIQLGSAKVEARDLTEDELKEGMELIADIRAMRAGKTNKAKAAAQKEIAHQNILDQF